MKNFRPSDRLEYILDGIGGAAEVSSGPPQAFMSFFTLGLEVARLDPAAAVALADEVGEFYRATGAEPTHKATVQQAGEIVKRPGRRLT